ncbi:MAG: type II toxin-antitoxin system VapC family toxin [Elusimicrobia bacterium]|nr:type II toxin-antitoxin system VapC family toxin [Elusimicrobiota bacterium]
MKYLLDTNVILEGLLRQKNAEQVQKFLQTVEISQMVMTDFSLHSIGVVLYKLGKEKLYIDFLNDMVIDGINICSLSIEELMNLVRVTEKFKLDFDDAYQYAVAEKYNLKIVSFDKDFDGTELGRSTPGENLT